MVKVKNLYLNMCMNRPGQLPSRLQRSKQKAQGIKLTKVPERFRLKLANIASNCSLLQDGSILMGYSLDGK